MTAIASLKLGDRIRARDGSTGAVYSLHRDHVVIVWDGVDDHAPFTDEKLKAWGIERVSVFEAEDTEPGGVPHE